MQRDTCRTYSILLLLICIAARCETSHAERLRTATENQKALTTSTQIHSLSVSEAIKRHPVHLRRALVLYYNPTLGNLFVRDATGGLYVDVRNQPKLPMRFGDLIELRGITGPGGYAPVVEQVQIRVIGSSRVPPPRKVSLDHLLTGVEDCQWVVTEGVVRDAEESSNVAAYANQGASGGG